MTDTDDPVSGVIARAWAHYGDPRAFRSAIEMSPGVSTNRVYRITLSDRSSVFCKVSSYGSFVHFRQDHQRIRSWIALLQGTRYANFLAPVLERDGDVFTYDEPDAWVVFYGEAPRRSTLPRILSDQQIVNLAEEMAAFHAASTQLASELVPTWQTLGSDIAQLHDRLRARQFPQELGLDATTAHFLKGECDRFLVNADRLHYHRFAKIPVLVDWNRGNFSVEYDETGEFILFSRWDYDWFRIESRMLDFYFFSRVVREEGDKTVFSYSIEPLFEPRFATFLRAYHRVLPLSEDELLFCKEAYRFFVLNYVLRRGQHFFQREICTRLQREAALHYLGALESFDFRRLADVLA